MIAGIEMFLGIDGKQVGMKMNEEYQVKFVAVTTEYRPTAV